MNKAKKLGFAPLEPSASIMKKIEDKEKLAEAVCEYYKPQIRPNTATEEAKLKKLAEQTTRSWQKKGLSLEDALLIDCNLLVTHATQLMCEDHAEEFAAEFADFLRGYFKLGESQI